MLYQLKLTEFLHSKIQILKSKIDGFVKSQKTSFSVIPAGIQLMHILILDSGSPLRFVRNDEFNCHNNNIGR